MNLQNVSTSNLLALLNENLKTVKVKFNSENGVPIGKMYTYKTDLDLEIDDLVVVKSPHSGYVVTTVVNVDKVADLVSTDAIRYKWVVSKVDTKGYRDRLDNETKLEDQIQELRIRQQRVAIVNQLKADMGIKEGDDTSAFEALLAQINSEQEK